VVISAAYQYPAGRTYRFHRRRGSKPDPVQGARRSGRFFPGRERGHFRPVLGQGLWRGPAHRTEWHRGRTAAEPEGRCGHHGQWQIEKSGRRRDRWCRASSPRFRMGANLKTAILRF